MTDSAVRLRLRELLTAALRERDRSSATAVRNALATLENAEAVVVTDPDTTAPTSEHVAGAHAGLGAAEAARQHLSVEDERRLLQHEIEELRAAAAGYDDAGQDERAAELRRAAELLDGVIGG